MGLMNIHHLELFYFVAKHGGIAAAVRNIPYGIQQPAVSGQIATGGITRHKALSASAIRAFAHGDGALRVHPAVLREH